MNMCGGSPGGSASLSVAAQQAAASETNKEKADATNSNLSDANKQPSKGPPLNAEGALYRLGLERVLGM